MITKPPSLSAIVMTISLFDLSSCSALVYLLGLDGLSDAVAAVQHKMIDPLLQVSPSVDVVQMVVLHYIIKNVFVVCSGCEF